MSAFFNGFAFGAGTVLGVAVCMSIIGAAAWRMYRVYVK